MLLFSERKTGTKKKGNFEILKKLCEKHFRDYLFQEVRVSTGPRLAPSYRKKAKFNLEVMKLYFLKHTNDFNMSPLNYSSCVTDLETLFDMLETAYCFQQEYLEAEEKDERLFFFEHQINDCLEDYGYEMKQGAISQLPEDGMRQLVEEVVEYGVIESDVSKIQHAIGLFFKRNATSEDKISAILSLQHLLEVIREQLKTDEFLKSEESTLFNVANNKRIRHMLEEKDKTKIQESMEEPYLTWFFYRQLNCIKTYLKISHL
ncbi:hypothetical protein COU78_05000 [Candidatus Peregrinibacteria bacterium CG10_big_fil_rev_8_21_14_0_10_49_24]|nr:MAG: hypothetical protein COU78_05000 [Candidatus Peregrinibacteria bacterium CG10_big_fil_rev_8_21_14_0_10_49_24]